MYQSDTPELVTLVYEWKRNAMLWQEAANRAGQQVDSAIELAKAAVAECLALREENTKLAEGWAKSNLLLRQSLSRMGAG